MTDSALIDWDSPVLRRHEPATYRAYPDVLRLERDDRYEEERKPRAGGRTNNARCSRAKLTSNEAVDGEGVTIMALGTDTRSRVNDFELVFDTNCERW